MVLESCKKVLGKGVLLALALFLVAGMAPFTADAAMEAGSPGVGEKLFTGQKRFTNGGPPCISCHNAGVGALGGGRLGPDLTKVYLDPSKNPLLNAAWINASSIPVMGPVFSAKNVTDAEVADLRAFFEQQANTASVSSNTGVFTIVGIGGFIGILGGR
jgi:mono/diheme cytochrome c family protein